MLSVEGYAMFRGVLQVTPKHPDILPFQLTGVFLYKPDTDCWYGQGRSFAASICEVVSDETED